MRHVGLFTDSMVIRTYGNIYVYRQNKQMNSQPGMKRLNQVVDKYHSWRSKKLFHIWWCIRSSDTAPKYTLWNISNMISQWRKLVYTNLPHPWIFTMYNWISSMKFFFLTLWYCKLSFNSNIGIHKQFT